MHGFGGVAITPPARPGSCKRKFLPQGRMPEYAHAPGGGERAAADPLIFVFGLSMLISMYRHHVHAADTPPKHFKEQGHGHGHGHGQGHAELMWPYFFWGEQITIYNTTTFHKKRDLTDGGNGKGAQVR